jgi:hypothetical protein
MSKHYASKVVSIALAEVNYHEKASNSQLDSKTANSGGANYTKYADYFDKKVPGFYNGPKNGFDWCDMFNDWVHCHASDPETARKALYQPLKSAGAGCTYSAGYYRANGAWIDRDGTPKPGDQIFFGAKYNEEHTGIVVEVTATTVTTVEGNSSEQVAKRIYQRTSGYIAGYGRPKYDKEEAKKVTLTLTDNGAIYKYAYKDILGGASKKLKSLKKGEKVTFLEDDGYGWCKVKSGDVTGWMMNSHFKSSSLSKFKTHTLAADKTATLIDTKAKKKSSTKKLKKGTKYTLICTIEKGTYKGKDYIKVGSARYYI